MEDKSKHPARRGEVKNKLKKIITFFTCVVLVFVSMFLYDSCHSVYGYSYYTLDNDFLIGKTAKINMIDSVMQQQKVKLENEGYYIVSMKLNPSIAIKQEVIRKHEITNSELRNNISKCLDIEVLLTKLTITGEDNIYYFKTEEECKTFISELIEISQVETKTEGIIGKYTLVSNQKSLQALKTKYEEREVAAAIEKRRQMLPTSSRSGVIRTSTIDSGAPLTSYDYISSQYGPRHGSTHTGVDFAASLGTEIHAWKSGTVITAGWRGNYGNFIEIQHNDGTISRYAHCSKIVVSVGQQVSVGQYIGNVGSTGNSTGPHLHLEIKVNGSLVNPLNYL